jgi:hypothetical protein
MKTLTDENNESERSSISKSQQILVEYENTKIWITSNESDLNDDDTRFDYISLPFSLELSGMTSLHQ